MAVPERPAPPPEQRGRYRPLQVELQRQAAPRSASRLGTLELRSNYGIACKAAMRSSIGG
jgi:hypothetical protein